MSVAWPAQLQQYLNEDSFSTEIGNTTLRSNMDIGPAKVRRRFTKSVDTMVCTINLTRDDFLFFETFYGTTLNGGVTPFTFIHPIRLTTMTARFITDNPPSFRSLGGNYFRVQMKWEIMP